MLTPRVFILRFCSEWRAGMCVIGLGRGVTRQYGRKELSVLWSEVAELSGHGVRSLLSVDK